MAGQLRYSASRAFPSIGEPRPKPDGLALTVRIEAAERVLLNERDREQSLNTRALGVGAATGLLFTLSLRAVEAALDARRPHGLHIVLLISAIALILTAIASISLAILGVLRPSGREFISTKELTSWVDDEERMRATEPAALFTILDSTIAAIASRRAVNKRKAKALTGAYVCMALIPVLAVVHVATLVA